jgi:hypothetical protein
MVGTTFVWRRRSAVAALAVVALAVVALLVWLRPAPARAQGDVHVFMPATERIVFLDFRREGLLRLGDRLATRGPLLDAMGGTEVGTKHGDCVVARAITDGAEGPGGVYRCSYLLDLAEGDLIVEGLDPHGPGVYTFAVVGGTEAYAGASGDATLTDSSDGTDVVINLT